MDDDIKPIGLWKSIVYFGVPGLLIYVSLYYFVPILIDLNISEVVGVMGSMWIVTIPLILIGIMIYRHNCKNISYRGFLDYFLFKRVKKDEIRYIVIGILISFLAEGMLGHIGAYFAQFPLLAPPDYLSAPFNPLVPLSMPIKSFMGVTLKGNWLFLLLFIPLHLLAMLGEEVIWRGYLLPRQVKRYGRFAWVLNGILWAWLMHCCLKWNFISMLPSMLITPFMAQKTSNTTVAYIIHVIPNTIIWLIILAGVLGI